MKLSFKARTIFSATLIGLFFTMGSTVMYAPTEVDTGTDPLVMFFFGVEAPGKLQGYFTECSGIGSETEIVENTVQNAQGIQVVQEIPGRLRWKNLVLKRGLTSNLEAWAWRKMVEDGQIETARADLTLTMYDQEANAVAVWNFTNCWPSRITFAGELSVEEITVSYEHCERVK